jgi:COP9 signalosome complex subunit 1
MDTEDHPQSMATEDLYTNGEEQPEEQPQHRPIISSDHLDIESYASLYTGRTKIARLMFIAEKLGSESAALDAYRMAYDEIKKGENTQMFREVVQKIDGRLGASYGPDTAWMDSVDRKAESRKEKLENELNAYRV